MCESTTSKGCGLSGLGSDGKSPSGTEGEDQREAASVGAPVEANSNPSALGSRLEFEGDGECRWHLSARGASRWLALSGRRPGSGAGRRPSTKAIEEARRQATGRSGGHGVWAAARGPLAMDGRAGRDRDDEARHRRHRRERDDSQVSLKPRAEAVAGKKCGAAPSATPNKSGGLRTA